MAAADWGNTLTSIGYRKINLSFDQPKKGDIYIIDRTAKNRYGHIAAYSEFLYRSGYGHKHGQKRILKIKLPHNIVADLLSQCKCKHSGGGSNGRVQWDPARDIMTTDNGKEP